MARVDFDQYVGQYDAAANVGQVPEADDTAQSNIGNRAASK
jgi:hypothetical protein